MYTAWRILKDEWLLGNQTNLLSIPTASVSRRLLLYISLFLKKNPAGSRFEVNPFISKYLKWRDEDRREKAGYTNHMDPTDVSLWVMWKMMTHILMEQLQCARPLPSPSYTAQLTSPNLIENRAA